MQVERRKEKVQARQKGTNEGSQVRTAADFQRAREENSRPTVNTQSMSDNYFYVTKNEYDYRQSKMGKMSQTPKYPRENQQ